MQGILCSVSFLKHVIQHWFGSSHKLHKCCILKKSEKFKAKAIHYAGRRYRDRSGRPMKPQGLFGQVHIKAHRKPVETKSNDFSAGRVKADGVNGWVSCLFPPRGLLCGVVLGPANPR